MTKRDAELGGTKLIEHTARLTVALGVHLSPQDNEISREQRRRQRTDKELRDVRSKLDLKTAEHEQVHARYITGVSCVCAL